MELIIVTKIGQMVITINVFHLRREVSNNLANGHATIVVTKFTLRKINMKTRMLLRQEEHYHARLNTYFFYVSET